MQQLAMGPDQISDLRPQASARPGAGEVPGDSCTDMFLASHAPFFFLHRSPW